MYVLELYCIGRQYYVCIGTVLYRETILWDLELCLLWRDGPYFRTSTIGDSTVGTQIYIQY